MDLSADEMRHYMERCINLAKLGRGMVGAPFVGSLVLSNYGEVLGEGYKKFLYGTRFLLHAERMALNVVDNEARGTTLFTTLEPCTRQNGHKNSAFKPCSELIVERGVARVVIGLYDNNEDSCGGVKYLERHGIEVVLYQIFEDVIEYDLMRSMRNKMRDLDH